MLRLLAFLKPYRRAVALTFALTLAQALAGMFLPCLMADIVDHGIVPGNVRQVLFLGGEMLLMAFVGSAAAVGGSYFAARAAMGFGRDVRNRVFDRVAHSSVHQFEHFGAASLITRTTNDTTHVQQVLTMFLTTVVMAPMMAIGGVVLSLTQDTRLARVLISVIPILGIVFFLILRKAAPRSQQMQVKIDHLNLMLGEQLAGVRVIRAFDRKTHESRRFDAANLDLTNNAINVNRLVSMLMPVMFLMMNLTGVAIIWFGAIRIDAGQMNVGAMMAALQYASQILFAVFMGGDDVRHAAARGCIGPTY